MNIKNNSTRMPRQERSISTRNKIIEAAMAMFSEKGYYTTNSKEIAKAADVSIGSFYSYFPDKKALFIEVLKLYFSKFNEVLDDRLRSITINENQGKEYFIREIITGILSAHNVFTQFHNELVIMQFSDNEVKKLIEEEEIKNINTVRSFLKANKDIIKVNDQEAAAVVINRTVHSVVDIIIFSKPMEEERIINELTAMLSSYIFY